MWVKYLLLHAQFSHHLGQLGTDMTFTHSIWDPSRIQPHDVDGSINPFHGGVHLVRCSLHESPSLCLNKGCMVIDANHSISSPTHIMLSTPVSQSPCDSCFQEFPLLLPKLHTQVDQLHLSIYVFTFRAVRKIYPMEQVAVCCILFGKQELTACNTFSV